MARRDDREYREYLREEQRRHPGSPPRVLCAVGWQPGSPPRVLCAVGWQPGSPPRVLCAVGWHPGCPARGELCCEPRGQDTSSSAFSAHTRRRDTLWQDSGFKDSTIRGLVIDDE